MFCGCSIDVDSDPTIADPCTAAEQHKRSLLLMSLNLCVHSRHECTRQKFESQTPSEVESSTQQKENVPETFCESGSGNRTLTESNQVVQTTIARSGSLLRCLQKTSAWMAWLQAATLMLWSSLL